MTRRILPILTALLGAACGDTTSNAPSQLNLDRPVDVAFACVGGLRITNGNPADTTQPIEFTATTTASCDFRSQPHDTNTPTPVPPGQEDLTGSGGAPIPAQSWYAFILQQGPGTVAVAQFQTKPATSFGGGDVNVLDADKLTPGKNAISVGEDPLAIVTDKSGCHEVIANAGSCDLSDFDINSAVVDENPIVRRFDVKNGAGQRIGAKPAAMVGEPLTTSIGQSCPKDTAGVPTPNGLVYIAYPGCHMVAAVDTATGVIQQAIQYDNLGVPSIVDGATITCPDECGGDVATLGARPVALDLQEDPRVGGRRMAIGADNLSAITIVELDPVTTLPLSLSQVALEDPGGLGIQRVAISPQIGMGGTLGIINDDTAAGGQFQFVYAVANDHSVRVADILTIRKECDTQVDPRFLRDVRSVKTLSCMPVGDPATPPRRPASAGPGITGFGIPLSVAIVRSDPIPGDTRPQETPGKLVGYFAVVTTTDGSAVIINVDDDDHSDLFEPSRPLIAPIPLDIAHQLRDGIESRGELARDGDGMPLCELQNPLNGNNQVIGGPRATTNPARTASPAAIAGDKVTELPALRQLTCVGSDDMDGKAISEVSFAAPEATRDIVFPDLHGLAVQDTWTLTYEGSLSPDPNQVRESQMRVDSTGMHIIDASRPFCAAGVEPFDIFQMRGCDPSASDLQCPKGYRCFVHPDSQITGLGECMLDDEAERLAGACKAFLTSLRRYTIKKAERGDLLLVPRRLALRTSPLDGCTDDTQCQTLANYALRAPNPNHPVADTTAPDTHTWTCSADPDRAPVTTGKICELRCDSDADCLTGTVCQGAGAGAKSGFCMEGVTPPQACVNGPQRYDLRAGNAFAVTGSSSGFIHGIVADNSATGTCTRFGGAPRELQGRIPLVAPPCDPASDPLTGKRPDGTFDPNPCSLTATTTDVLPHYVDIANGDCNLADQEASLVERDAPAIRFRNPGMNLTLVDPFYPGDSKCILDRGGNLGKIPLVFPGYQLAFRQVGGFSSLRVPVFPAFPVKVVRGPTQSLWIIDQGDFLSTSLAQPSTRGKVFRVEAQSPSTVNVLE